MLAKCKMYVSLCLFRFNFQFLSRHNTRLMAYVMVRLKIPSLLATNTSGYGLTSREKDLVLVAVKKRFGLVWSRAHTFLFPLWALGGFTKCTRLFSQTDQTQLAVHYVLLLHSDLKKIHSETAMICCFQVFSQSASCEKCLSHSLGDQWIIFKLFVLSYKQFKARSCSIQNSTRQRKVVNPHIRGAYK